MTLEAWHLMINPREEPPGTLIADFQIREDSPWFAGHFPEEPILPGVAILSMVTEMIGHFEGMQQKKFRIAGLKRVRFKLPVRPQDTVTLALSREKAGRVFTYAFQAWVKEELACAGVVLAEQAGIG
jgi:3-hydroxyacyl-[acyl-carrier-protein] dehydratase